MTTAAIKPATLRLVAQCFNQLCFRVPVHFTKFYRLYKTC